MIAVAQNEPDGVERPELTTLTGYKRSTRDKYVYLLTRRGYVVDDRGKVRATPEGIAALGSDYEPLPTGSALREHWRTKLSGGERNVFEAVSDAHPGGIERDQITELTGYKRSTRDKYLYLLGVKRIVETRNGLVYLDKRLEDG